MPQEWTDGPRGCYRYFDTPKTYWDALEACDNNYEYGNLVSITSSEEEHFLEIEFRGVPGPPHDIWTGGIYMEDGQKWQWIWSDGNAFSYTQMDEWQPKNESRPKCLRLHDEGNYNLPWKWDPVDCSTKLGYVCYLPVVCQVEEP